MTPGEKGEDKEQVIVRYEKGSGDGNCTEL